MRKNTGLSSLHLIRHLIRLKEIKLCAQLTQFVSGEAGIPKTHGDER